MSIPLTCIPETVKQWGMSSLKHHQPTSTRISRARILFSRSSSPTMTWARQSKSTTSKPLLTHKWRSWPVLPLPQTSRILFQTLTHVMKLSCRLPLLTMALNTDLPRSLLLLYSLLSSPWNSFLFSTATNRTLSTVRLVPDWSMDRHYVLQKLESLSHFCDQVLIQMSYEICISLLTGLMTGCDWSLITALSCCNSWVAEYAVAAAPAIRSCTWSQLRFHPFQHHSRFKGACRLSVSLLWFL